MRSALAGIPLVSTTWINACRDEKKVILPSENMFVRSLPIKKSTNNGSKAHGDYGVAKIAAQAPQRANRTLRSCTVHLCGTFSRPPKADLLLLLRESGATSTMQVSSILAKLRNIDTDDNDLVVLLCDDNCSTISDALHRQVISVLENPVCNHNVIAVNPQWLFDSVVSGLALGAEDYPPKVGKPLELWRRQQL